MKLSKDKSDFIIRFKHRWITRSFLIDTMADVADRPIVLVEKTDIHNTRAHTLEINPYVDNQPRSDVRELLDNTNRSVMSRTDPTTATEGYDPPLKEIPNDTPPNMSEIMLWRAQTGIDIVHPQANPYELIRNYNNWLLMDYEMRKESDKMCKKHFYYDNVEYFQMLMKEFMEDGMLELGDIVLLATTSTKQVCRVYLDEIKGGKTPTALIFKYLDNGEGRPFSEIDTFSISKGDIDNYDGGSMETTVGRFLLNQLLLAEPFKHEVKYWNDKWNFKKMEAEISNKVMEDIITIPQLKKYQDNLFFIGHFSELCVPTFSRKSLGTDSNVSKVKKELLEKHKDNLTDPLVISEIESTLIDMDKNHLKDDTSMRFYGALGGRAFDVHRKKMYLTVGGIQAFSKDSGEYAFLPNSLSEGWEKEYLPVIANEIRKGSYSRGTETRLGGVQTKLITRVFQDLNIYMPDCGTTKGLDVDFSKYPVEDYIGRWVLYKGTWVVITEENKTQFKGLCSVRSPMYCTAPKGLCYKCVGEIFRKLTVKQVAAIEIDISSTFLTLAMKNMHGTKLELFELKEEDLGSFIST